MMDYFIKEFQTEDSVKKTAGVKARDDADAIFAECGLKEIQVVTSKTNRGDYNLIQRMFFHKTVNKCWKKSLQNLKKGDRLFVQFPIIEHSIFLTSTFKKLSSRGIEIYFLIHDLELLRFSKRKDLPAANRVRLILEEKNALKCAAKIIAHNEKMKNYLIDIGIDSQKIVLLKLFDYLIPDFSEKRLNTLNSKKNEPVIIAGTLRRHKVEYAYHLPDQPSFNLYGVGYEETGQRNISYKGAFEPNDLVYVMEGSFGLVWDGERSDTCSGVYGDYLRINNPHKMSLYLAAGIPVITWKEAALADFIRKNKCGILVDSVYDIKDVIDNMSDEEYTVLKHGAGEIGSKVRAGYYLRYAVQQCVQC